jgi:hypothetical protein
MGKGQIFILCTKTRGAFNKTELTIVFDAEKENPVDMQQQGWQLILDNFKKYNERN